MDAFPRFKVTMSANEANRLIAHMHTSSLALLYRQWQAVRCSNQYVANWARILGMIENELGCRGEYDRYIEDVATQRAHDEEDEQ